MNKYRDFQIQSAIKIIRGNECENKCNGYKVDGYCNGCAYKIALDIMKDEVQRARRRK